MRNILLAILKRIIAQTNTIIYATRVHKILSKIAKKDRIMYDRITKAVKLLQENTKYPSLQTHEIQAEKGPNGEKMLRSMITQGGSGWRLHWYEPKGTTKTIMVVDVFKHE